MTRAAAILLLIAAQAPAATLAERIEKILEEPAARRAFWGVKAVELDSGRTIYEHNAERLFVPASNTKLFSTSLALARLGPEHRFLTRVASEAPPDVAGRIAGDVTLVGGGDPNLSARVLPYETRRAFAGDALAALDELAGEIAALGVRRIDGDIVGDDSFFEWQRYPPGWAVDDLAAGYGAPVTALVVNDNTVRLEIRPGGRVGEPALVRIEPFGEYFTVDNRIVTADIKTSPRSIRVNREPGERTLRLWGEIAVNSRGRSQILAVSDPALVAAEALRAALLRKSIQVLGRATCRHALPHEFPSASPAVTLASRSSMPLIEDLKVINKVSHNLHAEVVLRTAARARRGEGSIEAAAAEMRSYLEEIGLGSDEFFLRDGSGLSRLNLVSPAAVVRLLVHMWKSGNREAWLDTLPVAALDGTLERRFAGTLAAERLQAKTGTLSHVSALSGYWQAPNRRPIAFAVLVNNYASEAAAVRRVMDRVCVALLED